MRLITYVFKPHVGEVYGGERSCAALLGRMAVERAVVVNVEDPFAAMVRRAGVPVRVVAGADPFTGYRGAGAVERARRALRWLTHNARLVRALRGARPDVIHANDVREVVMGAMAFALLRRPLVTHVRCEMRMRPMHQLVLWASTATISVSERVRDVHVARCHPRLRRRIARRSSVVHNGVDLSAVGRHRAGVDRSAVRRALGCAPDDVLVLLVGSLEERKGQLEFVERVLPTVLARSPSIRVMLAGGAKHGVDADASASGYGELVARRVSELRAGDRVHLLGFRSDVFDLYAAADVVVLPSKQEGLPRSILEASAFGLPAVAFGVSGTPECIDEGVSGFVVTPGDYASFAERLIAVCTDAASRERLGAGARRLAEDRFDLARTAERTLVVLARAAGLERSASTRR
jgi:glycosyltransferase involved in cell wall biosynthesis